MTDDVWTIKAALEWTQGYLARKGDENPRLSAEWLLAEATGLRRVELYVNFERPLSMEERDILRGYVSRRGAGEPLQYITGEVAFRHIAVKVRPGVLIPRPETEVLVSEALSLLPPAGRRVARDSQIGAWEGDLLRAAEAAVGESGDGSAAFSQVASALEEAGGFSSEGAEASGDSGAETLFVADLCTGSGCIACSIAYERPDARVIATDISPDAVALAGENAGALGLADRVRVVECDLAAGVPEAAIGKLHLVVSNPPYVPTAVMAEIPEEDFTLVKEALDYYKTIRGDIKRALPFWPLGTSHFADTWVSLGLKTAHKAYITVWRRGAPDGRCTLPVDFLRGNEHVNVRCAYPANHNTKCAWNPEKGTLTVDLPAPICARIFELEY